MKGGRGVAAAEKKREREKLKKRRQRAKKAAAEVAREVSPCPPSVPPRPPGDMSPSVPPGDTPPPAPASVPPAVRRKPSWQEDSPPRPEVAFFAWCQEERLRAFPQALLESAPASWGTWYGEALAAVGGDEGRLRAAWQAYLGESWARSRKPVCPVKAFINAEVWRRHVPDQDVPAEGASPASPASPAEARRRAALDVGRGAEPPRTACATYCGATSCTTSWGHALCARCAAQLETDVPLWTGESVTTWVEAQQAHRAQQETLP